MRRTIERTLLFAAVLTAVFCFGAATAEAQHGCRVTKRVAFKKGEVETVVKGTIPHTLEGHAYIFRAREGQSLLVSLFSAKKDVGFLIETPSGEILDGAARARSWAGELKESGDYRLIVNTETKGAARYALEIQLAADI